MYKFLFINRKIPVEYTKVFSSKSDYLKRKRKKEIYNNRITERNVFYFTVMRARRTATYVSIPFNRNPRETTTAA